MTKRVRIVSDGRVQGTKVLMPDGTPIPGVRSVEILPMVAGGTVVEARVTLMCVELDVTADVVDVTPLDATQRVYSAGATTDQA